MEPSLADGRVVMTLPVGGRARRGDVVALHLGAGPRLVKRLVAGPGDIVELESGRLRVNDVELDGPRVPGAFVQTWTVPPEHWFVVGDNRSVSTDSRSWAEPFVPSSAIQGRVLGVAPIVNR